MRFEQVGTRQKYRSQYNTSITHTTTLDSPLHETPGESVSIKCSLYEIILLHEPKTLLRTFVLLSFMRIARARGAAYISSAGKRSADVVGNKRRFAFFVPRRFRVTTTTIGVHAVNAQSPHRCAESRVPARVRCCHGVSFPGVFAANSDS